MVKDCSMKIHTLSYYSNSPYLNGQGLPTSVASFRDAAEKIFAESKIEMGTYRLNIPSITSNHSLTTVDLIVSHVELLEKTCKAYGFDTCIIGPVDEFTKNGKLKRNKFCKIE